MLTKFLKENISGNIIDIKMDAQRAISLIMIKYEMLFNYLSEQTTRIIFEQSSVICEPVYRCTMNIPNEKKISWQIFSDERNLQPNNMIIIIWEWDKKDDILYYRHLKSAGDKTQDELPYLHAYVHVCSKDEMQKVFTKLILLDNIILSGIHLGERKRSDFENIHWNEIEIYRSYDWGMVTGAWNRIKQNLQIETITEEIGTFLKEIVKCSSYKESSHLIFDYPYPVEDYIYKIIYGGRHVI